MTPENWASLFDKGIVIGLFVLTFIAFIWKGIPYLLSLAIGILNKVNAEHTHQLTKTNEAHTEQVNTLTKTFENTLNLLVEKFLGQIEEQHRESAKYHLDHGAKIEEIGKIVKSLKTRKNGS